MSYGDVVTQTVIAVSGRLALTLRAEAPWHDDIFNGQAHSRCNFGLHLTRWASQQPT